MHSLHARNVTLCTGAFDDEMVRALVLTQDHILCSVLWQWHSVVDCIATEGRHNAEFGYQPWYESKCLDEEGSCLNMGGARRTLTLKLSWLSTGGRPGR